MAIVNRDLDPTSRREVSHLPLTNTITGQTYPVLIAAYPAKVVAAEITGVGLSGAPNVSLWLQRFVAGVGVTSVVVGQSMVLTTFGTSGPWGFTLLNGIGSTFPLQAGDCISLSTAAANTGSVLTTVTLALEALQDVKTAFGQ